MKVALLFITDGRRECAGQTLECLAEMVGPLFFEASIVVDDSCSEEYSSWLNTKWPWSRHLPIGKSKRGFDGAIAAGWEAVKSLDPSIEYVFHLEDDFVMVRHPRFRDMERILRLHPEIVQVALKRQPWNQAEIEAGGIVELDPDSFIQQEEDGLEWYEQRKFFTTNPSLYRRALVDLGWPRGKMSEGRFTRMVLNDPEARFAYLGQKFDEPWVLHIGNERTGTNY